MRIQTFPCSQVCISLPTRAVCAEGVLYAEKDFNLAKHPEIDVPNLQVIKLMQSFKSKELVTERFAWRHYYWCAWRVYAMVLVDCCAGVAGPCVSGICETDNTYS